MTSKFYAMKRFALALALPTALMFFLAASTPARAESAANTALKSRVDVVLGMLKSPEFKNTGTRGAVIDKIEAEITKIFDFNEFSVRTIGPRWKEFTPDEQKKFIDAFSDLLRATYIDRLSDYNGEHVEYTGEATSTDGSKVEIKTIVRLADRPAPVNYRMLEKNGSWVVYDVNIEGVSLVQNYRTQFQDILSKNNAEGLIKQVNEKAAQTRESNKTSK